MRRIADISARNVSFATLDPDASLYALPQILSVTLFEKLPLHRVLDGGEIGTDAPGMTNQLNLFAF